MNQLLSTTEGLHECQNPQVTVEFRQIIDARHNPKVTVEFSSEHTLVSAGLDLDLATTTKNCSSTPLEHILDTVFTTRTSRSFCLFNTFHQYEHFRKILAMAATQRPLLVCRRTTLVPQLHTRADFRLGARLQTNLQGDIR